MELNNILSLFDGMSCGQLALQRAGIQYKRYFASEIDKHAMKIAKKNFPHTLHIGDITKLKGKYFPKIDLIMGGSPCQGFSAAGKGLNFKDPRSKLFFEFIRLIKECKPKYFLLENVKMKKEWVNVISTFMKVKPVLINSALLSAQNRNRLYWCNWNIKQPKDKNIILKDILDSGVVDRDKSYCLDARYYKGNTIQGYYRKRRRQIAFTEERTKEAKQFRKEYQKKYKKDFCPRRAKQLVLRKDNKMNCLTGSYSLKEHIIIDEKYHIRKLTPVECERLQTLPDNYTLLEGISNTQRYKMIGNGWTVDIIMHIFNNLKTQRFSNNGA